LPQENKQEAITKLASRQLVVSKSDISSIVF